ncbi:methyltransferase domain-containing protein [Citrobacter sp. S2-9]|uniref:Methyltransferase domain-containing protein n=1 Tax=Citrobacter enshiensis TaxID=2971264 RepID=A0ABT8PV83_9ENTR|nr:methyltransferase domain-containing protein [Citrobacter enshiensis]MDN8600269.1 methyltransferase domain-containing protein [Citrobacter enshiensis]
MTSPVMIKSAIDSVGEFSSVDMTNDPRWFIDFMDNANCLPDHEIINQRLVEVMAPLDYKRILEFGCGTGNDIRHLVEIYPEVSEIVGIDLSETMISEANSRTSNDSRIRFEQGDGKQLTFGDNIFDGARAKLVLMHCDDIDAALDELIRVVKTNGKIAVYDHDFDGLIIDHPNKNLTRKIVNDFSDKAKNSWSGRQLFSRFLRHGLINVTVESISVNLTFDLLRFMILGQKDINDIPLEEKLWWEELAAFQKKGCFFASFIGFLVVGTK